MIDTQCIKFCLFNDHHVHTMNILLEKNECDDHLS